MHMNNGRTILGITAEYDPFHRGHAYQIEQARKSVSPDAVICVMSGDFTQRGEPAIADKWERAKIAVQQGLELVFELPFMYAVSRAEQFARGAVNLLAAAGATHISFGCEAEHPEKLVKLAGLQYENADRIEEMTRSAMEKGISHVKAAELACKELFGEDLTNLMLQPNNILALEYLKRMYWWEHERGIRIKPVPVRRFGSGYREAAPSFAGGAAIREMVAAGEDISAYLPYEPGQLHWISLPAARANLYRLVRGIILRLSPEELQQIYCVGEGMENRLLKVAARQETYEGFLSQMTSRRYTASSIRRIMLYILMNVREVPDGAPYGTVLAASAEGRKLLRDDLPLHIISNPNRTEDLPEEIREALFLDRKAADMFHLICGLPLDEHADRRKHPWMK